MLTAIADGCTINQWQAKATIVRQTRGLGLLRAYDAILRKAR